MLPEAVARKMADVVAANARLVQIPNAGHAIAFDAGPALQSEIASFLAALP